MTTTNSQDKVMHQAEEQQEEVTRWSEEAIRQRRLDNLKKARETLKKKREDLTPTMSQPFSLTPVTLESLPVTPRVNVEEFRVQPSQTVSSSFWNALYGISSNVFIAVISVAIPAMVATMLAPYKSTVSPDTSDLDDRKADKPATHLYNGQSIFIER